MNDFQPYRQVGAARPGEIICVADHASNFVPDDIELGVSLARMQTHIALDLGVEGVAERLARRHAMPAHIATVSRLVCDLHRTEMDDNLIPASSDGQIIAGNIGANRDRRIERFHRPYHDALDAFVTAAKPALIVALHSFTPELEHRTEERPWQVALLYNRDDRAARHAIRFFTEQRLTVGDNQPYSGKELNATMDRHAEARGIPYLTIEIRQDQIRSEAQQARWAAHDRRRRRAHGAGAAIRIRLPLDMIC